MSQGSGHRRILVVSPHFDDAPLSLGQSLTDGFLASCDVSVCVVFGRTNWSTRVHPTRGRAPAITAWRRLEEAWAARRFGYRSRAERFEEVILRTGSSDPGDYRHSGDLSEDPLFAPIREKLRAWRVGCDELWVPAGLGRHVDHRLVALAGASLVRSGTDGIAFYEDRPYASFLEGAELEAELDELGLDLGREDVSGPISESTHARVRSCYRSQMSDFFLEAQRQDLASERPERVWRPVKPEDQGGSR